MLEKKITPPKSGEREIDGSGGAPDMTAMILDALEQGVILWSSKGTCLKHNDVIFEVLELPSNALGPGTKRDSFLAEAIARGEQISVTSTELEMLFAAGRPFNFECILPSGRVVSARVRPIRDGGHIVAYTDITHTKHAVDELLRARADAEAAQRKADAILLDERKRQREASRMTRLDEWLQSCKSLQELYEIVTAFMKSVLPASRGQLLIYSNARDVLECTCNWNLEGNQGSVTPDSCWALRRGRVYLYEAQDFCFQCDHVSDRGVEAGEIEQYLCVPIVAHGDTVGLLHLQFDPDGENPDVLDPVAFSKAAGEHISMAIANVKLRDELQEQSSRDPLTGLFNRRYFLEALRRQLLVASSQQSNFAVLSIDADNFKTFNDEHGHDAGDQVLEAVADRMMNLDVDGAVACRLGGEEFALLLPNADRTRATFVAEEFRAAVSEMRVSYLNGHLPKVTVSIGIAIYPTHGTDGKDLLKQSDVALYAAKDGGRNCWKVAEGDGMIAFD